MCWLKRSCTDSLSIELVFPYLPIVNDNIQQDMVSLKMSRCYTSFDEKEKSCYFECKSKESFFCMNSRGCCCFLLLLLFLLGFFLSWLNFGTYSSYNSGAETIKEFFFSFCTYCGMRTFSVLRVLTPHPMWKRNSTDTKQCERLKTMISRNLQLRARIHQISLRLCYETGFPSNFGWKSSHFP